MNVFLGSYADLPDSVQTQAHVALALLFRPSKDAGLHLDTLSRGSFLLKDPTE